MNINNKIVIERICRALISLIPFAGSPLEQLTFGLKESFENNELIKKLEEIESQVLLLNAKGLSADSIIHQILESIKSEEAEILLIKQQNLQDNQKLMKVETSVNQLQKMERVMFVKFREHLKEYKEAKKRIEGLKNETHEIFANLNYLRDTIDEIKSKLEKNNTEIKVNTDRITPLIEEIKCFGQATKIAVKEKSSVLLSPTTVFEYINFPFKVSNENTLFLEYIFSQKQCTFYIFEDDLNITFSIFRSIKAYNYYKTERYNRVVKLVKDQLKDFVLSVEEPTNDVIESIYQIINEIQSFVLHRSMFSKTPSEVTRHKAQITRDVWRFYYINEQKSVSFLYPIISKREERIYKFLCSKKPIVINNIQKSIVEEKVLAISVFLRTRPSLVEDIQILIQIFETLKKINSDGTLSFSSELEIRTLNNNLSILFDLVTSFKDNLKTETLNQLSNTQKQLDILNNAFSNFFDAYAEMQDSFRKDLIKKYISFKFEE